MKIHQIRVRDFRSYKGEQSFDFSVSPGSSVSMLFGMNGSGKTTLLNAFTWALYGEMSSDVEKQGELANRTTWNDTPFGDQVSVEAEVTLEHGGVTYVARRVADVEKSGDKQTPRMHGLQLWEITADGRSVEVGAPQQKIEMMLPKELSRFFFFNGERIEKLVGTEAYSQIKQDVKTLLGLEVIERSLADLIKVKRKLGSELKTDADDATRSLQEDIERRELQLESVERDLRSLDEERALLQEERESVLQALREHAGVAPLQALRDETHKRLESLRANQSVPLGQLRGHVDPLCLRESLPKAGGEILDRLIGGEIGCCGADVDPPALSQGLPRPEPRPGRSWRSIPGQGSGRFPHPSCASMS